MIWRIAQASAVGTSHIQSGQECQDDCLAERIVAADGAEYFIGLVADGAGSAIFSREGAELACQTAHALISRWLTTGVVRSSLDRDLVLTWFEEIRRLIFDKAATRSVRPRDFACTFLATVIGPDAAAFFQIGDGAIVVCRNDVVAPVFWPDTGEYENTTHFITDDDALMRLRILILPVVPDDVAMFTDGLQRLALSYQSMSAHVPFFDQMFGIVRRAKTEECDALSDQLACLLGNEKVNERTDDDKTLVLASQRGAGGAPA